MADMAEMKHKMLAARVLAAEQELEQLRGLLSSLAVAVADGDLATARSVREVLEADTASRKRTRETIEAGPPPGE